MEKSYKMQQCNMLQPRSCKMLIMFEIYFQGSHWIFPWAESAMQTLRNVSLQKMEKSYPILYSGKPAGRFDFMSEYT